MLNIYNNTEYDLKNLDAYNINNTRIVADRAIIYRDDKLTVGYRGDMFTPFVTWLTVNECISSEYVGLGEYTNNMHDVIERFNKYGKLFDLSKLLDAFLNYDLTGYDLNTLLCEVDTVEKIRDQLDLKSECKKQITYIGVDRGHLCFITTPESDELSLHWLYKTIERDYIDLYEYLPDNCELRKLDARDKENVMEFYIDYYKNDPNMKDWCEIYEGYLNEY